MQPSLFQQPSIEIPESFGPASVRALDTAHILTPGKGQTREYDFTLNPYRGCSFGCSYCYAPFFEPDLEKRAAWGTWIEVKQRAVEALARVALCGKSVYMSSVTDPYQPIERRIGLTRSIVEHLANERAVLVVQTRSPLVVRDIDLFKRFPRMRVNMSITTDCDAIRKQFEPACASIERRLEAAKLLTEAGIRVSVCICPMLPMKDPAAFGRKLDEMGIARATASWFHETDRQAFAANTRPLAVQLAKTMDWTYESFQKAVHSLRTHCQAFGTPAWAFSPE